MALIREPEFKSGGMINIGLNGFLIDVLQVKRSHGQPSQDRSFLDHINVYPAMMNQGIGTVTTRPVLSLIFF